MSYILYGGLIAQSYKKRRVNNISNSNHSILFIEEELITKKLNFRGIARRYIYAK